EVRVQPPKGKTIPDGTKVRIYWDLALKKTVELKGNYLRQEITTTKSGDHALQLEVVGSDRKSTNTVKIPEAPKPVVKELKWTSTLKGGLVEYAIVAKGENGQAVPFLDIEARENQRSVVVQTDDKGVAIHTVIPPSGLATLIISFHHGDISTITDIL